MSSPNVPVLSRADLYEVFKTDRAVRLVEALILAINQTLPDGVDLVQLAIDNHIADTADAHQASAIGNTPAGGIAANTVQGAINELDTEKQPVDATLTALAAIVTAADRLIYATGADAFAVTPFTAFARTILDDVDAAAVRATIGAGTGSGTVTTVSVVSANGFAGSVANPGTTPAITISTSVTGLLKGDGTAVSAAVANTDYVAPGGNIGAATGTSLAASAELVSGTYVKSGSTVVASLPAAATAGAGARHFVTDANATTFLSVVAGGGANKVPVVSNGTNWLIG